MQEISAREFASTRKFIEELVVEALQQSSSTQEELMSVREKYLGAGSDAEIAGKQSQIESEGMRVSLALPALRAEVTALRSYLDGLTVDPPR